MKYGIDVCSYQGVIDWGRVKRAGCAFAVLKCIRKDLNPDTAFVRNVAGCRSNDIPISCYTYVYEGDVKGAKKRALAAVQTCQEQGLKGITVWWDIEDSCLRKVAVSPNKKNALHESILAARKIIEAAGYSFGIYCDVDFHAACLYYEKLPVKWWIARYGKNPPTGFGSKPSHAKPAISGEMCGWQYCSRGRVPGISGSVDLDVAYDEDFTTGTASAKPATGNPYPVPKGIVTSTAQAAEKGLHRWIPQGPQVKWVQWELQRLGYDLGKAGVDGICGPKTVAAIETFQRGHGLTVDGLCGPRTWAALKGTISKVSE